MSITRVGAKRATIRRLGLPRVTNEPSTIGGNVVNLVVRNLLACREGWLCSLFQQRNRLLTIICGNCQKRTHRHQRGELLLGASTILLGIVMGSQFERGTPPIGSPSLEVYPLSIIQPHLSGSHFGRGFLKTP